MILIFTCTLTDVGIIIWNSKGTHGKEKVNLTTTIEGKQ